MCWVLATLSLEASAFSQEFSCSLGVVRCLSLPDLLLPVDQGLAAGMVSVADSGSWLVILFRWVRKCGLTEEVCHWGWALGVGGLELFSVAFLSPA